MKAARAGERNVVRGMRQFQFLSCRPLCAALAAGLAACFSADSSGIAPRAEATEAGMVDALAEPAETDMRADVTADDEAPTVQREASYAITKSTRVYAQGLSRDDWTGESANAIDLLLDVYEPEDAPDGRPAMILIHGGGFIAGSREQAELVALAEDFAARGWLCFSIDYRLARDHGSLAREWYDHFDALIPATGEAAVDLQRAKVFARYAAARDAKAAVRWVHARADEYGIDTDRIAALGGSAGSMLSVMLGATEPGDFRDELTSSEDPTLATTNPEQPSRVHTVIDHWGSGGIVQTVEALRGAPRFGANDAPISIVHGTADETVPFRRAEDLRDIYTDSAVPFAFHPLDGEPHGAWEATIDGKSLFELAFDFIVQQQGLGVVD